MGKVIEVDELYQELFERPDKPVTPSVTPVEVKKSSSAGSDDEMISLPCHKAVHRYTQQGVIERLEAEYGIRGVPGRKTECPRCRHRSFAIASHNTVGKCFRPACGFYLTPKDQCHAITSIHGILIELFQEWHRAFLAQRRDKEAANAWNYCQRDRRIHPYVLRDAPIGVVPNTLDLSDCDGAIMALRQEILETASDSEALKSIDEALILMTKAKADLEKVLADKAGWLAFFYTDEHGRFTSIRFRNPNDKQFISFKPLPKLGVFGSNMLFPGQKPGKGDDPLIVVEGEFNLLQLQTIKVWKDTSRGIGRAWDEYLFACAVGSASGADLETVCKLDQCPLVIYDYDISRAGYRLVTDLEIETDLLATTTLLPDTDLDAHIRSFGDDIKAARSSVRELVEDNTKHRRLYASIWKSKGQLNYPAVSRRAFRGMKFIHYKDAVFQYEDGYYRERKVAALSQIISDFLKQEATINHIKETVNALKNDSHLEDDLPLPQSVCVKNGLVDLKTGQLRPHSERDYHFSKVPVVYEREADCPKFKQYLNECLEGIADREQVIRTLQEFTGYIFMPEQRFQKSLILIGRSHTGKSVFLDVLQFLIGEQNFSAVSINDLDKPFCVADLLGKLMNLSSENEVKEAIEEANFKKIISGEPIQAQRKYGQPFTFRPYAKFVMSTNNMFRIKDKTDAMYRRIIPVFFDNVVPDDKADPQLARKLATEELAGILNWALLGLRRLLNHGGFKLAKSQTNLLEAMKTENNPLKQWLDEECDLSDPSAETSVSDAYSIYCRWCRNSGYKEMNKANFSAELLRLFHITKRKSSKGTRPWVFVGIKIEDGVMKDYRATKSALWP